jgi:hypothetical protein
MAAWRGKIILSDYVSARRRIYSACTESECNRPDHVYLAYLRYLICNVVSINIFYSIVFRSRLQPASG